jgi:hypothetical protein
MTSPVLAAALARNVGFNAAQALTGPQQALARSNIGAASDVHVKYVTFYKNMGAAGAQQVTGVGFQPRLVTFQTSISGGANWASFGQSDGNYNSCVEIQATSGGGATFAQAGFAGIQREDSGGGSWCAFNILSLDADGFTVNWSRTGAPSLTASVFAICHR